MAAKGIIVWMWEDERMCWRPYEPHVSNFIEQNRSIAKGPLNLGPADIKMKHYAVDLSTLYQTRITTGRIIPFYNLFQIIYVEFVFSSSI